MDKVLESKERIERIAEFIEWSLDCGDCPISDKCWSSTTVDCKKRIADYLTGNDKAVIKQMLMKAIVYYLMGDNEK